LPGQNRQGLAEKLLVYGVCVEEWLSAALSIRDLGGRAARLHGHDYKVVLCVEGELKSGVVVDHEILHGILKECVDPFDYSFLNETLGSDNASAEEVARALLDCVVQHLPQGLIPVLMAVCTPRGRCSYIRLKGLE